jgi:hypothetical protein
LAKIHFFRNFVTENVRNILRIYCYGLPLPVKNVELIGFLAVKAAIWEILSLAAVHLKLNWPFFDFSFLEIIDKMVLDMRSIMEQHHK